MSRTDKQLAGQQRRTLRKMRQQLLHMAGDWDGRDQFNVTQLTELADQAQQVATEMVSDDGGDRHGR